jgi:hypothetical protein
MAAWLMILSWVFLSSLCITHPDGDYYGNIPSLPSSEYQPKRHIYGTSWYAISDNPRHVTISSRCRNWNSRLLYRPVSRISSYRRSACRSLAGRLTQNRRRPPQYRLSFGEHLWLIVTRVAKIHVTVCGVSISCVP